MNARGKGGAHGSGNSRRVRDELYPEHHRILTIRDRWAPWDCLHSESLYEDVTGGTHPFVYAVYIADRLVGRIHRRERATYHHDLHRTLESGYPP